MSQAQGETELDAAARAGDEGPGEARPAAEYRRRLARWNADAGRWRRHEGWLSHLRLAVFLAALILGWFVFGTHQLGAGWLGPPAGLFLVLVIAHDRVIQARRRAERRAAFYEGGLARLEDRWAGLGDGGESYHEARHPYAEDLDLFGEGSLFELVCTARTPAGRDTLAGWLKGPAAVEEIRARQEAVIELRPRLDLREDLALLGDELRSGLSPEALVRWGSAAAGNAPSPIPRALAPLLAALSVAALAAWIFLGAGPIPLLGTLIVQGLFAMTQRARVREVLAAVDGPTRDLALLRGLLSRLEAEPVSTPRMQELEAALRTEGLPPSRRIAQLQRLVDLLDARRNQFFAPFGLLLLWSTQLALAIGSWHVHYGPALAGWLQAAGEIEALAALAGYAYEHPEDVFPEVAEEGPVFEGRGLGHPLLPEERCVRNDLQLGPEPQALVISGSNMSGKSTYLRTAGCNALLAFAGAPVRAEALRISPLAIGASLQIADNLREGTSHFYAEIQRLRGVMDLTEGTLPVLFLLDEILHGTNSHDRRIGASAVVRQLVERGSLGLVTTHDLALAKIADELAPRILNVHFQDHLENGKMCFDYTLQPGVVSKSNALELMRSVGLEVT